MKKELKNIKRIIKISLLVIFTVMLISCSKDTTPPVTYVPVEYDYPNEFKGILKDKKIYITSIGQSIDIENFKVYVDFLDGFDYVYDEFLTSTEVEENAVVLAIVGCSIKALADAGIGVADEMVRAKDFTSLAKNNKITLISWHLGGMARRGSTSDKIIETMFSNSNFNIFVESGNQDYYLSNLSNNNHIPAYQILSMSNLSDPLEMLIGE